MWRSRDPLLEFWDPPNISQTVEASYFKFGRRRKAVSSNERKCKIGSKGVMSGSRDPLLEFWDPPNISRTVEARNFKFGTETDVTEF